MFCILRTSHQAQASLLYVDQVRHHVTEAPSPGSRTSLTVALRSAFQALAHYSHPQWSLPDLTIPGPLRCFSPQPIIRLCPFLPQQLRVYSQNHRNNFRCSTPHAPTALSTQRCVNPGHPVSWESIAPGSHSSGHPVSQQPWASIVPIILHPCAHGSELSQTQASCTQVPTALGSHRPQASYIHIA